MSQPPPPATERAAAAAATPAEPHPALHFVGLATPRPPVPLKPGLLTIGSSEQSHLRLRSPTVGALHAAVVYSGQGGGTCLLVNLDGPSGPLLNGKPVTDTLPLRDGDLIRVGPFGFRFADAPAGPPAASPAPAQLAVVGAGDNAVDLDKPRLIGARPDCGVHLPVDGVAPLHALVARLGDRDAIWRLTADAPVLVAGKPVSAARLRAPQRIDIGPVQLRYGTAPARPPAAPPVAPTEDEGGVAAAVVAGATTAAPRVATAVAQPPATSVPAPATIPAPPAAPRAAVSAAAPSVSGTLDAAPPPAASSKPSRLRPFTRRTPRPAPPPAPSPEATAAHPVDAPPSASSPEPEAVEPAPAGSRWATYGLMLLCIAAAAAAVWRTVPPQYEVRGAVTFQAAGGGPPLASRAAVTGPLEARLLSPPVLDTAVRRLTAPPTTRGVAIGAPLDPGFLTRPGEFSRRARVGWRGSPDRPDRATLELTVRTPQPAADARRVDALLAAAYEAASSASTRPSVAALKLDLVRGELEDLKLEIALRRRNGDQVRREIRAIEAAARGTAQAELARRREAALNDALDAAIEERVSAQARVKRRSGRGAGAPATSRPATAPANSDRTPGPAAAGGTGAAGGATVAPPAAGDEDSALAEARQQLEAAQQREADLRAELRAALRESANEDARDQRHASLKQRLQSAEAELPLLEQRLKAKQAELDELRRGGDTPVEALPPEAAHVVSTDDPRPLWIAALTAVIAAAFGAFLALSGRPNEPGGRTT